MHGMVRKITNRFQWGPCSAVTIANALCVTAIVAGPVPAWAHEAHGHPARIHEGSCEDLGPVAFRLNGVGGGVDLDNAPVATPTTVNPDSAYQVMVSETAIDGVFDDMLGAGHAVMVYESDEAMDAIACGNVGGVMDGDTLITGLAETGVPGHVGFALFRPEGEQIVVSVILGHAMSPVSASGAGAGSDHSGEEEAAHEHDGGEVDHEHEEDEEDGHAAATPAP